MMGILRESLLCTCADTIVGFCGRGTAENGRLTDRIGIGADPHCVPGDVEDEVTNGLILGYGTATLPQVRRAATDLAGLRTRLP